MLKRLSMEGSFDALRRHARKLTEATRAVVPGDIDRRASAEG
jgi:hypothetical protein